MCGGGSEALVGGRGPASSLGRGSALWLTVGGCGGWRCVGYVGMWRGWRYGALSQGAGGRCGSVALGRAGRRRTR